MPENARSHYALGLVLTQLDRIPEADRSFARAAELDPEYVLPCRLERSEFESVVEGVLASLPRCLRCLLLVMCTHPFAKKALTLHLARSEGRERYFGRNLMHCRVLASFHQPLDGGSTHRPGIRIHRDA